MSSSKKTPEYDVIIVGAGISGSIIAKELSTQKPNLSILVLEAGTGSATKFSEYEKYNDRYFNAVAKVPNSPYPDSPFAPSPSVFDPQQIKGGQPSTKGYFVQKGPFPFLSNYNKNVGGTTLHWLGTTPRMCPNDFKMKTAYGQGVNWPIDYKDLQPFYRRAEHEIGVSAEVEDQSYIGIDFKKDYVYPMQRMPQSFLDQYFTKNLKGKQIPFNNKLQELEVRATPQGRNGMPNPKYIDPVTGEKYQPVGAVGNPELGQRCEGNANCVPICPVQAKYNAVKSLNAALQLNSQLEVRSQSPVSTIEINPDNNQVKKVKYKTYEMSANGARTNITEQEVSGKIIVLAANAIENAKILLASNACRKSEHVGRNLMDHLVMLTWGFMPKDIGAYRGPGSTSGIPIARDGNFRKSHAAFWIEIGNWGWNWPANAPEQFLIDAIDGKNPAQALSKKSKLEANQGLYGKQLIEYIRAYTGRQFRMGWEIEQLPNRENRISIDENYKDALGNFRPIIDYHITDYEKKGAYAAAQLSKAMFDALGVQDMSNYRPDEPGYFEYKIKDSDKPFSASFNGAGHVVGCHRMGDNAVDAVVDKNQRAHEHANLYVTGAGSFPTLATSNPTLTLAALAFRTADAIIKEL